MPRFDSLYSHGFVRVAACTPRVEPCKPSRNAERTLELARRAQSAHAVLAVFPELGLSGYAIEDLAQQDGLLDAVERAIVQLLEQSREIGVLLICGAPLRHEGRLYNCALLMQRGRLLAVVPKTYLPAYREFYERRQYSSALHALRDSIDLAGQQAPFGAQLLFTAHNCPQFVLHVEICEDLWVPIPPSSEAALAGASVIANLSASDVTIGKADYRRQLCRSQSARCLAAYLFTAAGYGESTTDLAWDGQAMICENGEMLAEAERFERADRLLLADIDLDRLRQERMRMTSFNDAQLAHRERLQRFRNLSLELTLPVCAAPLQRSVPRFPYVPSEPADLDERCREVYEIQTQGLMKRMQASGLERAVIGISGGLDSTQALLVTVRALDRLGLPRSQGLACALPGPATSPISLENALRLGRALGVRVEQIDIGPSVLQMLRDIGHPAAQGEPVYDLTYENVQAGERASHLFRLANRHAGLLVGTSDLSELALGYTTYGVGDQMSHYAVNASVPKTLMRHLLHWLAGAGQPDPRVREAVRAILALPSSPELIPPTHDAAVQSAEATVGPYALHDFFLYYLSRFGYRPAKVLFLAEHAWSDRQRGDWPETVPQAGRCAYDRAAIGHWLEVFLRRFFEHSQFKRSALPNGPKIGSGGSLSPRSDWRAPSDVHAEVWLEELARALR